MDVVMPKMGESVNEGTIIKWHKKEGDSVKRDEIIFEISTDKVDTEIPAPEDGVIKEIKYQEGDTVEVGEVVAILDTDGDAGEIKETDKEEEKKKEEIEEEKTEQKKEKDSEEKSKEKSVEEESPEIEVETTGDGDVIEIKMPKMGESVMEGTIIKWYKKTGEKVKKDETLFEISTDKVDTEVPSPEEGILQEILVGEQETVEVGTPVAKLSTGEEKAAPKKEEKKEEKPEQKKELKEEEKKEEKQEEKVESSEKKKETTKASRFYSPLVMKISQEENVLMDELESIDGTGIDGRVTKKDILRYIEDRKEGKVEKKEEKVEAEQTERKPEPAAERKEEKKTPAYGELKPVESNDKVEKIPMDNVRQKIMEHMINSRDTSVHVSAMLEVDMTKIHNFIQKNKESYKNKEGIKLTYLPFIAYAVTKGLKEFPLINASIENNTIIRKKYINLGIAVAIEPNGLIVPNVKDADEKNIVGLTKSINDIATRARNKKLSPDDISGGTFTITNYGVFGTIFGTPIINQPEVAIIGVGTVIKKPVVVETQDGTDTIAIKPVMALTLSHDHRIVDGMLGGRFLKYLKDTLEDFNTDMV